MIFVDTSAFYALADRGDANHESAKRVFADLLAAGEPLLTHNYVLVESLALIQHRLGPTAAIHLADEAAAFEIEWVDMSLHTDAVDRLRASGRRRVSFVDLVSFLVMRRRRIATAFAYDPHFAREGFQLAGPRRQA